MKTHTIEIRLTKEEAERIKAKAKTMGLTISGFMRLVALKSQVKIETD